MRHQLKLLKIGQLYASSVLQELISKVTKISRRNKILAMIYTLQKANQHSPKLNKYYNELTSIGHGIFFKTKISFTQTRSVCKKTSLFSATQHCFALDVLLFFPRKSEQRQTNHTHSPSTSAMHSGAFFCLNLFYVLLTHNLPTG